MPFTSSGSPITSSSVIRGFSEAYGSWKIICMFGRMRRSVALVELA